MTKVIMTFIRSNPPTRAHRFLLDTMLTAAYEEKLETPYLFMSKKVDKENPLSYSIKRQIVNTYEEYRSLTSLDDDSILDLYSSVERVVQKTNAEEVEFYCGSDRFEELSKKKVYFESKFGILFTPVLVGERRDCMGLGIKSVSSTKMREAVLQNDEDYFVKNFFVDKENFARTIFSILRENKKV